MTDKQIIIDGVDVSECPCIQSNNIGDVVCVRLARTSLYCKGQPCYYKALERKEQECEELKKIINEAKNSKLDLNSFFAIEATVGGYQLELDQLKTENKRFKETLDELFKIQYKLADNNKKLRQRLTEIKEIAEDFYLNGEHVKDKYLAQEILQKISEYEVE